MPTSRKTTNAAMPAPAAMPSIHKERIDEFVTGPMSAEAVHTASMTFKKALIERALDAELSHHLGYLPGATKHEDAKSHRNGAIGKTLSLADPLRPLGIFAANDRSPRVADGRWPDGLPLLEGLGHADTCPELANGAAHRAAANRSRSQLTTCLEPSRRLTERRVVATLNRMDKPIG